MDGALQADPATLLTRRRAVRTAVVTAALSAGGGGVARADAGTGADAGSRADAGEARGIPMGYDGVDPRTATRVPLTMSLRDGVPLYPGDPPFRHRVAVDTRTPEHLDGGYLLEQITSLGTHTASHISAPCHFVLGAPTLADLGEAFTLMPLAVLDVRARIRRSGPDFRISRADVLAWEKRHGPIPPGGCVLMLTGYARLAAQGSGAHSPYVTTPAPGFAGPTVAWLYEERGILAVGSDTLGPDATSDATLRATTSALVHGGITVENVGTGLSRMRARGDWIAINGNRPAFSGFQMGFTGFTR